jgi:predicted GH43/DUF377 family glycosyl hydrolase
VSAESIPPEKPKVTERIGSKGDPLDVESGQSLRQRLRGNRGRAVCPRGQVHVEHREVLGELRGARDDLAIGAGDDRVAVEDQFVLTAHQVHERHRRFRLGRSP